MFEWSEVNRHVIGGLSVAAVILGVAILGSSWSTGQRSRLASLEDTSQSTGSKIQQPMTQAAREIGSMIEHRSASDQQSPEAMQPQPPRGSTTGALGTAASAWKNWSNEDWQIAIQAVEEHRSVATTPSGTGPRTDQPGQPKPENQATGRSSYSEPLQWKAPEEISKKAGGR